MTEPASTTGLWRLLNLLLDKVLGRWMDRSERSQEERRKRKQLQIIEVSDGDKPRYFSWRGRGDVHLVTTESEPRQLMSFFEPLCEAIRRESRNEPQFDDRSRPAGEIVYEFSTDFKAKWRLLGGTGGAAGTAILVVTTKPARNV